MPDPRFEDLDAEQFVDIVETYAADGIFQVDLPDAVACPETKNAQDILAGAGATVHNTWFAMRRSRAYEKTRLGQTGRGRMADWDVDLLRAAVVFAGAGLDATLKSLIPGSASGPFNRESASRRRVHQIRHEGGR